MKNAHAENDVNINFYYCPLKKLPGFVSEDVKADGLIENMSAAVKQQCKYR